MLRAKAAAGDSNKRRTSARLIKGKKKSKQDILDPTGNVLDDASDDNASDGNDTEPLETAELPETRKSSRISGIAHASSESSSPEKPESPPAESVGVSVVIFKFIQTDPIAIAFQQLLENLQGPPVTLAVGTGNLTSLPVGFRFTDHLMTGKGATTFDHQFIMSCSCPPGAASCQGSSKCPCKVKAGDFTTSNPEILKEGRTNALAIIECHRRCKCDIDCFGRVVQRGRKIPLEIFWAGTKGWGLRCPEKLPRGILVDKYLGEVIGPREASRRAKINDKNGASYLFTLNKFDVPRGKYHAIDGERFGSVARFINHSCSPNLTAYAVVSDRRDWKVYDIAFFTNKVINAGEELTYDYLERVVSVVDEDAEGWECLCGSEGCKGYIF